MPVRLGVGAEKALNGCYRRFAKFFLNLFVCYTHVMRQEVKSPCVRNCCLNEQDICLGCARHLDEIIGWGSYTDAQKIEVLKRTAERSKTLKPHFGWRP